MKRLGLVIAALVAISACSMSDKQRAIEFALKACQERSFDVLAPPDLQRASTLQNKFPSLTTPEAVDEFIRKFPSVASDMEDDLAAHREYITKRDEIEAAEVEYQEELRVSEGEREQFLFDRQKNARAAALLDESFQALGDASSEEGFKIECAAVQEVYG